MKIFDIHDSKISDINIIIIILPHAKNGWILRVSAWFHQNALLGNHLPGRKWIQEGRDEGDGRASGGERESAKKVAPVLFYDVKTSHKNFPDLHVSHSRNILSFAQKPWKILKSKVNPEQTRALRRRIA